MHIIFSYLIILNLLFTSNHIYSQDILISKESSPELINDKIQVYFTPDTLDGIAAWRQIKMNKMTKSSNKYIASSELKNNTFWILFKINHVEIENIEYYLNFTFNRTDRLRLYEILNDSTVQFIAEQGDIFPFNSRPIDYRTFIFPLNFLPLQKRIFILNADKRGSVDRYPLRIFPKSKFERLRNMEYLGYGVTLGLFLMIVIWSIIIYFISKGKVFLYYGLYTLLIGLYLCTSLGFTFQFISSDYPGFNNYNLAILGPVSMIFFSFFSLHFFSNHVQLKWLAIIQKIVTYIIVSIVAIPLLALMFASSIMIYYMTVLISAYACIIIIFCCVFLRVVLEWNRNRFINGLFFVGVFFSFTGIVYSVLIDNGVFHDYLFSDNANSIITGFGIEFILMTIALATKYKTEKHEIALKNRWYFIEGQELEKKKIASDLHDNIGASLYFLKSEINNLQEPELSIKKELILKELQNLSSEIRQISYDLLPVSLQELGFVAAVEGLCHKNKGNVKISFSKIGNEFSIEPTIGVQLFRILQELLKNSIEHGNPTNIYITIEFLDNSFSLSFKDDGCGADPTKIRKGIGLRSIEERVQILKAKFKWEIAPQNGCYFSIKINQSLNNN